MKQGNYKKDILKVNKSKTNLNKKQLQRAIREARKIRKLYKKHIPTQYKNNFIYPLESKQTSLYGNSRIFNKTIKSYHSGLDFRAKINTPIKASNDGIVVFAGDLFYSGKSIIISHGDYVFTLYAHLNKINVKKNDNIKQSQIIGLSGKSGRVTGAHLHFGTIVNSIKVNPKDFIDVTSFILHQ